MARGYVYVLENDSFPGLLKIGFTRKDPAARARELSATGIPDPYVVLIAWMFDHPEAIERAVHQNLEMRGLRYNKSREFFRVSLMDVLDVLFTLLKQEEAAKISASPVKTIVSLRSDNKLDPIGRPGSHSSEDLEFKPIDVNVGALLDSFDAATDEMRALSHEEYFEHIKPEWANSVSQSKYHTWERDYQIKMAENGGLLTLIDIGKSMCMSYRSFMHFSDTGVPYFSFDLEGARRIANHIRDEDLDLWWSFFYMTLRPSHKDALLERHYCAISSVDEINRTRFLRDIYHNKESMKKFIKQVEFFRTHRAEIIQMLNQLEQDVKNAAIDVLKIYGIKSENPDDWMDTEIFKSHNPNHTFYSKYPHLKILRNYENDSDLSWVISSFEELVPKSLNDS